MNVCADCKASLAGLRVVAKRCKPCRSRASRKRHKARRPRQPRICGDCGTSIEHRYHNARSCEPCHAKRTISSRARYETNKPERVVAAKAAYVNRKKAAKILRTCERCGKAACARGSRGLVFCAECKPSRRRETRLGHARRTGWADSKRRRAREIGADGDGVSVHQWAEILAWFDHRCAYCLERVEKLAMDHVEPLTTGGADSPENVVPACKSCNSRKNNCRIWQMLKAG